MNSEKSKNDLAPGLNKEFLIIVNSREKVWKEKKISFEQVVVLAFESISNDPNVIYTITYKRGIGNKPEGSMINGEFVNVKEGMIFNVTQTNRS